MRENISRDIVIARCYKSKLRRSTAQTVAAARPLPKPSLLITSPKFRLRRTGIRVCRTLADGCVVEATPIRVRRSTQGGSMDQSRTPGVQSFDCVELCVSNVHQAAHFFRTAFGFDVVQRAGPDTGSPDVASLMLAEGGVRLVVTSGLGQGRAADHVHRHGDSVSNIGLLVDDVTAAFTRAVKAGAAPVREPERLVGRGGAMRRAIVGTPGDLVHALVERDGEAFLPDAAAAARPHAPGAPRFRGIDHRAITVAPGDLDRWVDFYREAFGFELTHEEVTETATSSMRSKVVENRSRTVKFPLLEPAPGKRRSQIQEFLSYHNGPGVQHLALLCDDIDTAMRDLRSRGVEFLNVPDSYYESLPARLPEVDGDLSGLRELRLLMDRDEWGSLIQTFSKPVTVRPTLFVEVLERRGP